MSYSVQKLRLVILIISMFLLFNSVFITSLFAQTKKLVIALGYVPHVQFAPFYLAQEYGYFKEKNLSVTLQYGVSQDALLMLSQDKIHIALVDSDQFIFAYSKKLPIKAFYQYYKHLPICIFSTHVFQENFQNLIGKQIGVPELFGTSFFALSLFLKHYQLKKKVKIVRVGYEQIAFLNANKITAAIGYRNNEPLSLEYNKKAYDSFNISNLEPLIPGPVLVANKKSFQNKEILNNFVWALKKASQHMKNDPDSAFQTLIPLLKLRSNQISLTKNIFLASIALMSDNSINPKAYKYTMDKLIMLNKLQSPFSIEEGLDLTF